MPYRHRFYTDLQAYS